MKAYVALFRGLNVGGKNVLPMKDLVALLEGMGLRDVETYIQSGNAAFRSEEEDASLLSDRIRTAIEKDHGFGPQVLLLEPEAVERAVLSNPFPEAEPEPKTLHVYFLASTPERPDLDDLERIREDRERFVLEGGIFYLHAPDGVGRSRLAGNWRTVRKVLGMAEQRP